MQENKFIAYWKQAAGEVRRIGSITGAGVLSALGIALKSLSINVTQVLRVNFAFLTAALSGYMYGPLVAGFAAMVVDVIGYLIVPTGAYFFGFTFNSFVNGIIYGCWLYNKPVKLWRCLCAVATSMLAVSFILNPLWLSILYGDAFLALVILRIPGNAVLLPVNTALLFVLLQVAQRAKKQMLRR